MNLSFIEILKVIFLGIVEGITEWLPISSTAKVMYARMLDIVFLSGMEDANGILFIHFPIVELAAALARSTMTVKRSLNELEDAGLILRVRQGFGEPNKIYVLIPKKEDSRLRMKSCGGRSMKKRCWNTR